MLEPRANIRSLHAYVPGEQPGFDQTAAAGGVIKLNTNENPYPPSERVMAAIRELVPEALRLYPPAAAMPFRKAAAALHGLGPEQVIATHGGDELLRLLITAFCEPGGDGAVHSDPRAASGSSRADCGIGITDPTYTLYSVLAQIQHTPVTTVVRSDESFALPEDAPERFNAAGCRLAFLVNPHAPTGRLESLEFIRDFARRFHGLLVVDEAYVDFAPHDALPLIRDGLDNVILLRSLSKGYSLAGLRVGYGLAHASIIQSLDKVRDSYNLDIIAQVAAVAALQDRAAFEQHRDAVIAQRAEMTRELQARGFDVADSASNFLLIRVSIALPSAHTLYESLKAQGILIRYFARPRLEDKLRITIGTPQQNRRLLEVLDTLLG